MDTLTTPDLSGSVNPPPAAVDAPVAVNIAEARQRRHRYVAEGMAVPGGKTEAAATANDTSTKNKDKTKATSEDKPKPPSLESVFAEQVLKGVGMLQGPWYADVPHTTGGEVVYRWNGSYLQHVGGEDGVSMATEWLLSKGRVASATSSKAKSCWEFACKQLRLHRKMPKPSRSQVMVPCKDVYLEVCKSGEIIAHQPSPTFGFTHAIDIPVGIQPGERLELKALNPDSKFARWLTRAQPEAAIRELIQEQCGMTLLPYSLSVAVWWYGAAGSGKSMLAELLELTQRQAVRIQLDQLNDTFGLETLVGASLVVVDEVEQEKWGEARFKSLVSGNGVNINRKHEKGLPSYHLEAKWIITSNPRPFVRDKTDGVWRRLDVVEWAVVVPEEERIAGFHHTIFEEEGQELLHWMLAGALRIIQRGRYRSDAERPQGAQEAKKDARLASDSVLRWIVDCNVRVDSGHWETLDAIYAHYEAHVDSWHGEPLGKPPFWRALNNHPRLQGLKCSNRRQNGKQVRMYNLAWGAPMKKQAPDPQVDITDMTEAEAAACFPLTKQG